MCQRVDVLRQLELEPVDLERPHAAIVGVLQKVIDLQQLQLVRQLDVQLPQVVAVVVDVDQVTGRRWHVLHLKLLGQRAGHRLLAGRRRALDHDKPRVLVPPAARRVEEGLEATVRPLLVRPRLLDPALGAAAQRLARDERGLDGGQAGGGGGER